MYVPRLAWKSATPSDVSCGYPRGLQVPAQQAARLELTDKTQERIWHTGVYFARQRVILPNRDIARFQRMR